MRSSAKRLGKSIGKISIDDSQPAFNVHKAVQELPKDVGVHRDYVQYMVYHIYRKDEVRIVLKYVRSTSAGNLTPHERQTS